MWKESILSERSKSTCQKKVMVSICIIGDGHIFIPETIGERVCTRIYEAIASQFRPVSFLFYSPRKSTYSRWAFCESRYWFLLFLIFTFCKVPLTPPRICGSQHGMSGLPSLQYLRLAEEFEMPGASMIDIDSSRPLRFTNLNPFLVAWDEITS